MTSRSASILADPDPQSHIVFPCTDDNLIAQSAALFAAGGLANQETVVLITTLAHGDAIEHCLENDGFDIVGLKSKGELIVLDAERQLAKLLVDEMPDPERFKTTVKNLIATAKQNSRVGRVRVFAEMVSLIWKINLAATVRLEELWNDAIASYSFPVLCTYSLDGPGACGHPHLPASLLAKHSATITPEARLTTWSSVVENSGARTASREGGS